jgi:hypothetical protein
MHVALTLRMKLKSSLALIMTMARIISFSQNAYHFEQSIPVEVNGKAITMPWAGGLNSAEINTIDLNGDGIEDLAVFDRTANKMFAYLRTGNQYSYASDYEDYFPSSINQWVLLRDFNCDGKKDLFTSDPAGIAVFVNTTRPGSPPSWRPFNPGHPLLTHWYNGSINLQVNGTDIPAIDDIDEDGDLDIIVAQFVGYGSMEFHKNMSMEKTGRCDSLQLNWITSKWGNFEECNCGRYAFGGIDCSQLPGGRIQHDAGKSLLTLDLNNDGRHDLLFSEQNCTSLYLLSNQGTRDSADMKDFTIFPPTTPSTLLFPASYYEDMDFDGVKDLIISTNISARVTTDIDLSNSIWFYKNTGTNALPIFSLKKTNLLQDQMIDAGSYASPAFADFDSDGDLDMFISYWAVPDSSASIYQYENIGSFSTPSFKLVTNDYANFSAFGFYNIKIQFEDFDKDGHADLLFTATDKNTSVTQLYILKNKGINNFDFSGQSPAELRFTISPLENVFVYDLNRDGLDDILCGRADGSLQYYKNTGVVFAQNDLAYLGLKSDIIRFCASPVISDLKHDGKPDLILGNRGSVVVYEDFQSRSNPVADSLLIGNEIKNSSRARKLSSYINLTTADLYANGNPLIIAGTITGGLNILKSDSIAINENENAVAIWPNPVSQNANFSIRATQNSVVQFFNVIGQKVNEPIDVPAGETTQVMQVLSPGLYIARVSWSGKSQSIKLIVR